MVRIQINDSGVSINNLGYGEGTHLLGVGVGHGGYVVGNRALGDGDRLSQTCRNRVIAGYSVFGFLSHGAFGAHGEHRTIDGSIANGYRHLSGNTSLDCFIHGVGVAGVGELHRLGCHESSVIGGCVDQLLHLEGANLLDVGVGHGRDVVGNLALFQGDRGVHAIGLEYMTSDISISFAGDLAFRADREYRTVNGGAVSIGSQFSVRIGLNSAIHGISIALVEQLHRLRCIGRLGVSDDLLHLEGTRLLGVRVGHGRDVVGNLALLQGDSGV